MIRFNIDIKAEISFGPTVLCVRLLVAKAMMMCRLVHSGIYRDEAHPAISLGSGAADGHWRVASSDIVRCIRQAAATF